MNVFFPSVLSFAWAGTGQPSAEASGDDLVQAANQVLDRKDFAAALPLFREAVQKYPQNDRAHLGVALALANLGREKEALPHFREAYRLSRGEFKVLRNMVLALINLGEYVEALEVLGRAKTEHPGISAIYYLRAVVSLKEKNLKQAFLEITEAIKREPRNAEYYILLGGINYIAERHAEAFECYEIARDLDPTNVNAYRGMGFSLFFQKKYDQAIKILKTLSEKSPQDYEVLSLIGTAYYELKKEKEALPYFDRAIALKKDYLEAHEGRLACLRELYPEDSREVQEELWRVEYLQRLEEVRKETR